MTNTEKINEIENGIQAELNEWNVDLYIGKLPKNFMALFGKAFMASIPNQLKMFMITLEKILAKKPEELTNVEVATMSNLIAGVPPKELYTTIPEAIKSMKELEAVRIDYNIKVSKIQQELNEKKSRLVQLSGASLSNPKLISV